MRSLFLKRLKRLLWETAHSRIFLPLVGLLCVAATMSFSIPVTAILIPAVLLRPRRWVTIMMVAVVCAAIGASILAWTFHDQGWPQLQQAHPEFSTSDGWKYVVSWVDRFGLFALALVCALPLPQTPALIVCAVSDLPLSGIFLAVAAGKIVKYGILAWMAATFPDRFLHYLHRHDSH